MKIKFLKVAQQEVEDAFDWYNCQVAGLGDEFLDELDHAVRRVSSFPESCTEIVSGLRRCLLARFPYGLIYGLDNDSVIIIAVAHLHRNPRYWADRLGNIFDVHIP
jgi:plasmid stabilization system protein ParE